MVECETCGAPRKNEIDAIRCAREDIAENE